MSNQNLEWNEHALLAWNQWKDICSICGCQSEYKKILTVEVTRAFQKKFHSVIGCQLDLLFKPDTSSNPNDEDAEAEDALPSQTDCLPSDPSFYGLDEITENENPTRETDESVTEKQENTEEDPTDLMDALSETNAMDTIRVNWAHEFDCGIIEKANSQTSPKNYKDYTWECIRQSNDPPLKVIRGQLLGTQGIINGIAERYLRNNFHQIWEKQISLQSPVSFDGSESATLEDTIADETESGDDSMLDSSDKEYLIRYFRGLLSNENAAIFLIYLTGFSSLFDKKFSLALPELRKYVGVSSSSSIYERMNNVILPIIKSLPEEGAEAMARPGACNFLIFLLFRQIKPEKRALPLLQTVINGMTTTKKGVRSL